MTRNTKIVLAVVAIVLIPAVLLVVVGAGVGYFVATDKEGSKMYSDAIVDGEAFGRTTDQNGCLDNGLVRLKEVENPGISQLSANGRFVRSCLETAGATPEFCNGVPTFPYIDWEIEQCKKRGRADAVCRGVMDEKHTFCVFP